MSPKDVYVIGSMLSNGHHTKMNKILKEKIKGQKFQLLYIVQTWIMSIKALKTNLEYYIQNVEKF